LTADAPPAQWQGYADQLVVLLQQRDLAHNWAFTEEQIAKLNAWLDANELLVQCLNVAVVPDREAILAGLLAPPAE
jgi:hypothetical protein